MDHLLNFSKRLGRLSEYLAEKSAHSSNVHQSKNEVTLVQFKRQEETKDFFFGESVCLGVDAEVPRRPDERHLKKGYFLDVSLFLTNSKTKKSFFHTQQIRKYVAGHGVNYTRKK